MNELLELHNLSVAVENKNIINNFSLVIAPGQTHALMGPNGSGKSSLAFTIIGHPSYAVTQGSMACNGVSFVDLPPHERARAGIFLSFQHPVELPGVPLFTLLKEAYHALHGAPIEVGHLKQQLDQALDLVGLDQSFAHRNLHEGCSGGEKKRLELVQMVVLRPKLVIFDEIDSGLDVDALKAVQRVIACMRADNPSLAILCITHYQRILEYCVPDFVHVLTRGHLVASGDRSLARAVDEQGYDRWLGQAR